MTGLVRGTVRSQAGGTYRVALEDGREVEASIRGRLKRGRASKLRVVIGDRVSIGGDGETWTVEELLPRDNLLVRRGRGGREAKVLAANLDRVLVVVSVREPAATPQLIDRLFALVEACGVHPVLVLNKVDLDDGHDAAASLARVYASIGYRVIETSAERRTGVDALRTEMCAGTCALIGPSGVGKSSLLNAVEPGLALRTASVSTKTGTGRHTTVGSKLIPLECGGFVADTPGFGDVGLWQVDPETVADCFVEFPAIASQCRFRACTHLHEPDCRVRQAVEDGDVAASRYESYRVLREEAGAGDRW